MSGEEIVEQLTQPEVYEAHGKLAVRLGVPIDDAAVCLGLLAEFRGLPLLTTARWVLRDDHAHDDDGGRPPLDEGTVAILRWHLDRSWGPRDWLCGEVETPAVRLRQRTDSSSIT